jgi:multicomponent Na+:H+ antiporter subunit G
VKAVADAAMLAGAALILVAAIGVNRFRDVLIRMHALSKATTLGLLLVLAGGALAHDHPNDISFLVLAGWLQVMTSPVGSNLLARATYRAEGIRHELDSVDELARDRADRADQAAGPAPTSPAARRSAGDPVPGQASTAVADESSNTPGSSR